jgi:ribose transport system permease protein
MSDIHPQAETEVRPLVRLGRFLKDNPVIPLIGLLLILIGVLEVMRPGIISPFWAGNTIKFAIPLAMLAACQVLTMLTGGIDLSAGIVATCAAFVAATMTPLDRGGRRRCWWPWRSARSSGWSTASAPGSRGCIR